MLAVQNHIQLRKFDPSDLNAFLAYRSDPEVAKFQSWETMSAARALGFLTAMRDIPEIFQPGRWTQIAIATDAAGLVGDMGLFLSEDSSFAELGVTIARAHWRKGIARAAMQMAIKLAFDQTRITHVVSGADSRHVASLALIRNLGFDWTHDEPTGTGEFDKMFTLPRPD